VQSLLHPSSLTVLPSSHASSDALTPSPQLDVHSLGSAVPQSKPHSTVHVAEHPSLDSESPSSHSSLDDTSPLPHGALHDDCPHSELVQLQPCSTEQELSHPSSLTVLPSSHSSP
jgi:hypothetical protein